VLRGEAAVHVFPARIDADLRENPYVKNARTDPRLVDPTLVRAFDELATEVRASAQREGYEAGFAEGLAEGQAEAARQLAAERADAEQRFNQHEAELARAMGLLQRAIEGLEVRQTAALADVEELVLNAVYDIAEAVVGRELALAAEPARDAVARALALVPTGSGISLRLHPDDAATIDLTADWARDRDIQVVPDPTLDRGDCVADAGPTRVDARISAALDRVRGVLAS
jgi:flagellar assembly protein FliH